MRLSPRTPGIRCDGIASGGIEADSTKPTPYINDFVVHRRNTNALHRSVGKVAKDHVTGFQVW